jgi:hypothetical protein
MNNSLLFVVVQTLKKTVLIYLFFSFSGKELSMGHHREILCYLSTRLDWYEANKSASLSRVSAADILDFVNFLGVVTGVKRPPGLPTLSSPKWIRPLLGVFGWKGADVRLRMSCARTLENALLACTGVEVKNNFIQIFHAHADLINL